MGQIILASEEDTKKMAQHFAKSYQTGSIWLNGELGAGKTTFVRHFLHSLGYLGVVKSPTYTIVEPYDFGDYLIYHVDLYRLCEPDELYAMGFFEYYDPQSLLLIEWASRGGTLLPKANLVLDFYLEQDGTRRLYYNESVLP